MNMLRKSILLIIITIILIVTIIFGKSAVIHSDKPSKKDLIEDYEYMWLMLEENYPLFEAAERYYKIDRKEIYTEYKNKILKEECTNLTEFYLLLSECLDEFHYMGHLSVVDVDLFELYKYIWDNDINANTKELKVFGEKRVEEAYRYLRQSLPFKPVGEKEDKEYIPENDIYLDRFGNIPSIKIESFAATNVDDTIKMANKLSSVLKECRYESDVVIDLRGNTGGNTGVWERGFLPFLGRDKIITTSYYACINGDLNRDNYPIDFFEETEYRIMGKDTNSIYEIESFSIDNDTNIAGLAGIEMESLIGSDLRRCDLFLKVTHITEFLNKEEWGADGRFWCIIDRSTASAALNFALVLKKAGIATILGSESGGRIGGNLFFPSRTMVMLPNSGFVIQFCPYYVIDDNGDCTELGIQPDVIDSDLDFWLWDHVGKYR